MYRFAIHTLGCKVNQCDTEALSALLMAEGYISTHFDADADIYIINTCTITHTVDKKSKQLIRRARRNHPSAFVAVCGCMTKQAAIPIPEADYVFDTRKPHLLVTALKDRFGTIIATAQASGNVPIKGKTRAFLKVQDGCDRFCAYCIVPYVRGEPVSIPIQEALEKAADFIQQGAKEIVVTGIQLAAYGKDNQSTLPDLLRQLSTLAGLFRLRISSIDPWAVDDDFLSVIKDQPKICDHFHLSLQSGCANTLTQMQRRYTPAQYQQAALALRNIRPHAAITTDVIVGFPGESDEDHATSLAFIRQMQLARLHVFPYSPRTGTLAATRNDQVSAATIKSRAKEMLVLGNQLTQDFLQAQAGRECEMLPETAFSGYISNYCTVNTATPLTVNVPTMVRITGWENDNLTGALL